MFIVQNDFFEDRKWIKQTGTPTEISPQYIEELKQYTKVQIEFYKEDKPQLSGGDLHEDLSCQLNREK